MEAELKEMIVDRLFLDLEPTEIETDAALADYGVDSFLLLELIVGIEEQFAVKFEQEDINAEILRSVASLAACIRAKQTA